MHGYVISNCKLHSIWLVINVAVQILSHHADAFKRNIDAANTSNVLPVPQKVVPDEPIQPHRLPADATGKFVKKFDLNMQSDHSSQQEVVLNEPIGGPQRLPEEEVSTGNSIVMTVHEQDIPAEPVGPPDATGKKPSHLIWGPEMMTKFVEIAFNVNLNRKDAARKIHLLMCEPSTTLVQVKIYLKKYLVALMKKINKAKRNVLTVQRQYVPNEPDQPQIILPEDVSADTICKAVTKFFDLFNTSPDHHSSQQEVVPVEPHERLPAQLMPLVRPRMTSI